MAKKVKKKLYKFSDFVKMLIGESKKNISSTLLKMKRI